MPSSWTLLPAGRSCLIRVSFVSSASFLRPTPLSLVLRSLRRRRRARDVVTTRGISIPLICVRLPTSPGRTSRSSFTHGCASSCAMSQPVTCDQRVFAERLPGLVAPSARRTVRLTTWMTTIGFALGGEGGARLLRTAHAWTGDSTLSAATAGQPGDALAADSRYARSRSGPAPGRRGR